jgi:hypothetical protein
LQPILECAGNSEFAPIGREIQFDQHLFSHFRLPSQRDSLAKTVDTIIRVDR